MKNMIECGFKRSMLMAAVLAAFLFAAGCGGGIDDPKKKINEGQDKTGTGQTDGSGSSSSDTTSDGGNSDNTGGGNSDNTGGGNSDNTGGGNSGTVSTEVKVKVQTISAVAGHDAVGAPYTSATVVNVTVDVAAGDPQYVTKAKAALATAVATALSDVPNASKYKFFKTATGNDIAAGDLGDDGSKTIFVGKEQ